MVFESLAAIITENLSIDESEIDMDTSFEELGIDDIDITDIVMAFEDQMGGVDIQIDDDMETVGDLTACIERQI